MNSPTFSERRKSKSLQRESGEDFCPSVQRRFLFDAAALVDRKHMLFHGDPPPLEDFNDIVDIDDNRAEDIVSQELCRKVLESGPFRLVILGLIIINAILIGIQTNEELTIDYFYLLTIFDQFVLTIFICELLLKWYYGFWVFWRVGWNVLDFIIILLLLVGPTLTFLGSSRILRILRVFRAFRSIRSVGAFAGLSTVVQTILQSIPDMANIVLLLLIILLVFAVMGCALFGKELDHHFGDLIIALFSLFIFVTQDGWVGIYHDFKNTKTEVEVLGAVFCFLVILLGAFVFANLIVAVVVTNLEVAIREIRTEQKAHADVLSVPEAGSEDSFHEFTKNKKVDIIPDHGAREEADIDQQKPLLLVELNHVPLDSMVSYFVILNAIEENLTEYKAIREDLDKIAEVIMAANFGSEREDGEDHYAEYLKHSGKNAPSDMSMVADKLKKGDILSNLMKMKTSNITGFDRKPRRQSTKAGLDEFIMNAACDLMHVPDKSMSKKQVNNKLFKIGKGLSEAFSEEHVISNGGGRRGVKSVTSKDSHFKENNKGTSVDKTKERNLKQKKFSVPPTRGSGSRN